MACFLLPRARAWTLTPGNGARLQLEVEEVGRMPPGTGMVSRAPQEEAYMGLKAELPLPGPSLQAACLPSLPRSCGLSPVLTAFTGSALTPGCCSTIPAPTVGTTS